LVKYLSFLILLLIGASSLRAQSCDSIKDCAYKALTITVTSGKGAQWVDVDTSYRIRNIDTAITFEAWLKPEPQPAVTVLQPNIESRSGFINQ